MPDSRAVDTADEGELGPAGRSAATAEVSLLGLLGYAELAGFQRLARDAQLAPSLSSRARMAGLAAAHSEHHDRLVTRLIELGADPAQAMAPFVAALDMYHRQTVPATWLEAVVKVHLGDGMAADFYREVAGFLDGRSRAVIVDVLADRGAAAFALAELRAGLAAAPVEVGRVSLWARRLVGEALSQTQHVLAEHDELLELLIAGTGDLAGVARMITRLVDGYERRTAQLGLNP